MIQISASVNRKDPRGGYVVAEPHTYDAMGSTLRAAFGNDGALPREMRCALEALDRTARRA